MGKYRKAAERNQIKIKKAKEENRLFLITTAPPPAMKTSKHSKATIYLQILGGAGGEQRTLLELPEPSQETDPAKTAPLSRREVH